MGECKKLGPTLFLKRFMFCFVSLLPANGEEKILHVNYKHFLLLWPSFILNEQDRMVRDLSGRTS